MNEAPHINKIKTTGKASFAGGPWGKGYGVTLPKLTPKGSEEKKTGRRNFARSLENGDVKLPKPSTDSEERSSKKLEASETFKPKVKLMTSKELGKILSPKETETVGDMHIATTSGDNRKNEKGNQEKVNEITKGGRVSPKEWGSKEVFLEVEGRQFNMHIPNNRYYQENFGQNFGEERRIDILSTIDNTFNFSGETKFDNFKNKLDGFFNYFNYKETSGGGTFSKGNIFEEDLDSYWKGALREKFQAFESTNPIFKADSYREARRAFALQRMVEEGLENLSKNEIDSEARIELVKKIRKAFNNDRKFIKKFLPEEMKQELPYFFSSLKFLAERKMNLKRLSLLEGKGKWRTIGGIATIAAVSAVAFVAGVAYVGIKIAGFVFQDFVNPLKEGIKDPKKAFSKAFGMESKQ
ncbi:MAG: hypothetical protein KAI16_02890 [Candidatus Pacebacteria bacterium]|nr:hypothetical protein [Candidatus Paceibacterota bacterium]